MDSNDKQLEGDEISETSDRFSDLYRFKTQPTKKKPGSAKSQGSVDRRLEFGSMTSGTMDSELMLLDAALASGFFETSKDPILLVTPALLITRINLSAEHILGYFNKELTNTNVLSLFPQHYAQQFQKRVESFLSSAKPGDIEEVRNAFVERKDGDSFHATIRLNLSQNLEEPCVTFVIRDESDIVFLQQKFQRRERDLLKEIEEKKNHLSRLLAQEEKEFYESQKAQEAQIEERSRQKNTYLSQTDLFSVRRDELAKEYLMVKAAHNEKDRKFQMEIDSLRKQGKFYDIHGIELERLELLFESESQELKYRQAIQAEELRIRQSTELNYKNEKQTKEAQVMKLKQLREAQIIRRMQKEERQLVKSQKTRAISDLREKQIEEIEELKRKHRSQLFDISNETTKARRSMKYEQQRAAASLLEHQTKISAEMLLQQQKEAEAIQAAQEAEAAENRREQEYAATQLGNHQKEILSMLAERHKQDTHSYKKQLDERKHFELLAEHCNDMISLHKGIDGKFRYCSPACQTLLGYTTEEMTNFVYQDLIHPEHRQDVQNELESIVKRMWKNKVDSSREEVVTENGKGQVFRLCKKDGTNVWIERTIKVLWHPRKPTLDESKPNGQIISKESEPFGQYDVELLFVTRNVSLRVEMEEQQRRTERAQATATTAAQVKRDFLAFIGHECRNPLNALFNITDFLWETDLNEHQRQYLSTIKQCSGDMLRILNDLLDLSKIEAGKIEIETTPFQVRQIVNEALHTMEAEAHKKQLYLKSTIDPNTPNWLLGDPSRLRQILLNLLGNGIKFTEKGGITVSVDVHDRVDEDTLFLQFKVIDTGVGIDKELMSKLFSMYGQASASDFRKYGGTGIGLRLCSLLIQQSMGGNIGIDSQKGEGTTLWFTIPFSTKVPPQALQGSTELSNETILMAPRKESIVTSPSAINRNHNNAISSLPPQTSALSPTQSGMPMRVLVVDDIALNRDIAVTILSRANCICTIASDGVEAVATFKENRFDLVFLDIQMPRMTGVEAAYIMREFEKQMNYKRTPIVAISGNVQPSEQALYFQSGMDYFLAKPFKKEDFMSVLTRVKTDFSIASETTTGLEKNGKGSDRNSKSKASKNGENGNSNDSSSSDNPKDKGPSNENDGKDAGARFPNNHYNKNALMPQNTSPIISSLSPNPNTSFSNQTTSSPQHSNSSMHVRVLVADSSLADRTIYQKILSQYDSEIVGSGEQALESFTNNTYDAIILDNNLEDVSARDVIAQIRRMEQLSNNHVPIVLVCSSLEEEEALRGCGASQCLIKGRGFVNRDVLLHAMLRCITGESIPKTPVFPDQVSGGRRPSEDEVRSSDSDNLNLFGKKPQSGSSGEPLNGGNSTGNSKDGFRQEINEMVDFVVLDWIFLSRVRSSGFFEDLLKLFISSMETILSALHKYTEERDMRRLVIEAHNGGTISANMGAMAISLACSTLRVQCGKGWSEEVSQLVSKVDHAVHATFGELLSIDFIKAVPNPSGNTPSWTITEKAVAFGRHRDNFSPPNLGTTVLTSPTLSSDDNQTSTDQNIINVSVLNPTRILIVDDVFMNQFIVQSILSKHQFQCDSVNNGAEAIKLFQTHHYDIVLMDVYMDQMSGVDVTRHIREIESKNPKKSHVPIVALTSITGQGRVKFIHQLKEAGVDDVIFKPVLRNNLLNRMEIWRSDISQCYGETPLLDPVILDDLKSMNALESGINQFMENSQSIYDQFDEFSKDILEDKLISDSRVASPSQSDSLDGESGCGLDNTELVKRLNELTELSGVLGALRMAEFIATLTQYVSKQTIVYFMCKKLLKIFEIIRSATLIALNNASSPKIQAIKSPYPSPIISKTNNGSHLLPVPSPRSKNVARSPFIPPLDLTSSFEVDKRGLRDSSDVMKKTPSISPLNSPNSSISPNSPNIVEVQLSPIRHGEMIYSPKRISRPPHILVVDDQPLTRMVVTSMLLKASPGATFETAENGEQAVEKAGESDRFSLILMDINMPKMDGLKATRMIRSKQKEIYETKGKKYALVPIVAITSSAYQHLGTCLDAGMDDMLQKPFTIVKVQEIFKRFIATREERKELAIEITSEIITPLIQEISEISSSKPKESPKKAQTTTSSLQEIKPLESIFNIEIIEMLSGLGILEKTVETYKEQSQELLQKIADFIQNKTTMTTEERKYSRQQIHALKGISFNSGAQLVGKLCEKMETQVYELDLDTIKKTIESIRNALNQTKEHMKEILSRYK